MATNVSENEETETETNKTKVSDSGYSNSCSNSQSQRSNSSKSRHSTSSGSSGYCGHPSSNLTSSGDENHNKKKSKVQGVGAAAEVINEVRSAEASFTPPRPANKAVVKKTTPKCVDPAVLDNMSSPTMESEALQVGVLAQTLCCIHSKASEQSLEDQEMLSLPEIAKEESKDTEMIISDFKEEMKQEKEFCIVVSLSDGTVVCTTPSLTSVLGFPKDMWVGRSLINFLHPKDRIAFASHITTAMAHSHLKQKANVINPPEKNEDANYFYCWMRIYNGLKTAGFNVTEKKATYLPCQLSMNFKEVPDQGVFLVATARLVKSAYKLPVENRANPPTFTIRHTANTQISHVDNEVVSHFGYLPHDMIGRSIFDFYYAEDLPYLKDVYTNVIMEEGLLFLSRPYKFRCQNGDCVMVETEWSSFIDPWGKKLEFIIGRHRVLTGPQNPDVVSPVIDSETSSNDDEQINSKDVQEEIKLLLTEPIFRCYEPSKQQLAQLVQSLEKISSSQIQQIQNQPPVPVPIPSAASEMLGEISPHHVYSDSKSSSETPSYNQLTYNENIQRFFASEPKTAASNETQDPKMERNQSSSSGGEENKSMPQDSSFVSNSDSCLNGSSGISSDSARVDRAKLFLNIKPQELEPPQQQQHNPTIDMVNEQCKYNLNPLTEEMLYQHNENMNKQMALKHKKEKNKGQVNRKHNKNVRHKMNEEIDEDDQGGHGTKRSGSHSWEGEPIKAFKGAHNDQTAMLQESAHLRLCGPPPTMAPGVAGIPGVWSAPPFPVTVTTTPPVQTIPTHMNYSSPLVNPMVQLPCVYMNPLSVPPGPPRPPPPPPPCSHQVFNQPAIPMEHPGPPLGLSRPPLQVPVAPPYVAHQVQYMPSLMYQLPLVPMVYTQSHIVQTTIKPRINYMPNITNPSSLSQQPSSGATSVKGEPGSALCSFASASLQQGLSDSSKKENKSLASSPVYSPGFTSNTGTGKTKNGSFDNDLTHDDTSYCSYSSLFPKTEKSYDSLKDSLDKLHDEQYKVWRKSGGTENRSASRTALRKEPSWMENVDVTPDLMLRYQLRGCILSQVLQSDFETLLNLHQPEMVNDQLDQLYVDLEGLSKQLTLEESFPSSSSGDEKLSSAVPSTSTTPCVKTKKKKRFMGHDRFAMIFEEDAPMPPTATEMLAVESS